MLCTYPKTTRRCVVDARLMMSKDVELCRHKADVGLIMSKYVELCRCEADVIVMMNKGLG